MDLSQDFIDLLVAFERAGARFMLVGGYAVVAYTQPRYTKDIDLWVDPAPDNLERVAEALSAFGAPAQAIEDIQSCADDEIVWFGVPPGRVDILKRIAGVELAPSYARRRRVTVGDLEIPVLSMDDLIAAKRAAGRPQDLLDAERLEQARRARSQQRGRPLRAGR